MSECATLARAFFDESLQDSPVMASQLGVDGYDDRLDDLSEAAFEDRRRRAAAWLTRFEQLGDGACASFEERIDRDLIRSNLRGRVIPVMDLRKRFGVTPKPAGYTARIIVVEQDERLLGMMVDAVDEVLTVPTSSIEPVDEMVVSVDAEFLAGIVRLDERLIILLDKEAVLSSGEAHQLQSLKVTGKALKEVEAQAEEEPEMLPSGR